MAGQPPSETIETFRWVGSEAAHLDTPDVARCGRVVIGRYGGHRGAGAVKNEDGALVWCAADGAWEFAVLLDAHFSAESAALVLAAIAAEREPLTALLARPVATLFAALHARLLEILGAPELRARFRTVDGEASCLICARKGEFLWWMNIGDCVLYLLHPDLARLGQFALNQRSYFEWIGHDNIFDLAVPCYVSGVRALGRGWNTILLLTDGLLEFGGRPFETPTQLYRLFAAESRGEPPLEAAALQALRRVHDERGRDSATLLAWRAATAGFTPAFTPL